MICTIAPNKGGNDHSPSSWRLFSVKGGAMTNELHYSPVPKHIAANGRVVGDKVEISAVVYDGKSDVENVRVVHNGSAVNMTRVNGFTWRAEVPYSEGKYKIGALFTDSEVRVEEVKFQKGIVWERQLNGFGGLGTPIVSSDLIYVPLVDDQMSEHCGVVALDKNTGEQVWYYKTRGSVRNNMALEEGLLFVSDVTSVLYALNPADGSLVWSYKFRKDGMYPCNSQGVCYSDGMLYVGQGLHLTALKAKDGSVVWKNTKVRNTGITDVSTYAVADGVLCVNAYWVARYGFDAATGEFLWQKNDSETRYSTGTPVYHEGKWYFTAYQTLVEMDPRTGEQTRRVKQGHIFNTRSKMLIKDGIVVVGTSNHGMTGYRFDDFSQIWNTTTMPALIYTSPYTKSYEMSIEGDPVLYGDYIIYGANDGYVYCNTVEKGSYVWRFEMGLPVMANPVIDGEYLYVVDMGGKLVKLSLNDL
jgi:outer membrane protein assembly factor BamB